MRIPPSDTQAPGSMVRPDGQVTARQEPGIAGGLRSARSLGSLPLEAAAALLARLPDIAIANAPTPRMDPTAGRERTTSSGSRTATAEGSGGAAARDAAIVVHARQVARLARSGDMVPVRPGANAGGPLPMSVARSAGHDARTWIASLATRLAAIETARPEGVQLLAARLAAAAAAPSSQNVPAIAAAIEAALAGNGLLLEATLRRRLTAPAPRPAAASADVPAGRVPDDLRTLLGRVMLMLAELDPPQVPDGAGPTDRMAPKPREGRDAARSALPNREVADGSQAREDRSTHAVIPDLLARASDAVLADGLDRAADWLARGVVSAAVPVGDGPDTTTVQMRVSRDGSGRGGRPSRDRAVFELSLSLPDAGRVGVRIEWQPPAVRTRIAAEREGTAAFLDALGPTLTGRLEALGYQPWLDVVVDPSGACLPPMPEEVSPRGGMLLDLEA